MVKRNTGGVPLALQRLRSRPDILLRGLVETGRQRLVIIVLKASLTEEEICPFPITVGRKNKRKGFSRA